MTELFGRLAPGADLESARAELRTVHRAMIRAHPEAYPRNADFEIGAVRLRGGDRLGTFHTLVDPGVPIPPFITHLTGIDDGLVSGAPTIAEVLPTLDEFARGAVFVAHNARFDWRFLTEELRRWTGRTPKAKRLCTVKFARKLLPHLRRRNLDSLAWHYEVPIIGRHRAGGDARATAEVLLRLLRAADDNEIETFADLDQMLRQPGRRRKKKRRPPAMPYSASDDVSA